MMNVVFCQHHKLTVCLSSVGLISHELWYMQQNIEGNMIGCWRMSDRHNTVKALLTDGNISISYQVIRQTHVMK